MRSRVRRSGEADAIDTPPMLVNVSSLSGVGRRFASLHVPSACRSLTYTWFGCGEKSKLCRSRSRVPAIASQLADRLARVCRSASDSWAPAFFAASSTTPEFTLRHLASWSFMVFSMNARIVGSG